jgi:integrase
MHFHVRDIDFKSRLVNVRAKPEFGWQPKDREERAVPISDDLIEKLRDYVSAHPEKKLLFGTKMGKPDSHMLRRLKQTAFRAGLNCGDCVSKKKKSCLTHPVCGHWELHTFRRTFATYHHESGGVSIRTLADWLGHADPATTWGYIAIADKRSSATRSAVNNSFLSLAS